MNKDDLIFLLLQNNQILFDNINISNEDIAYLINNKIIVSNDNNSFSLNEIDNTYLAKLANRFIKRNEEDKALVVYKYILKLDENNYKALEKIMSYYIKRHMWSKAFDYFIKIFKCNNINRKLVNLYLLLFSKVMILPDFYQEYLNSLTISDITIDKNKYEETSIINDYMELITNLFSGTKINNIFKMFKNIIRRKKRKTKRDSDIGSFLSYLVYYEPDFNEYIKGVIDTNEEENVLEIIVDNISHKEVYEEDDNYYKVVFYLLASLDKLKGTSIRKNIPITKEEFNQVVTNPKYEEKEPLKTLTNQLSSILNINNKKDTIINYIEKIEFLISIESFAELKKILKSLTDDHNKESMKHLKVLIDLYDYCIKNNLPIRFDLLELCKRIILENKTFDIDDLNAIKKLYASEKESTKKIINEIVNFVVVKESDNYPIKPIITISIDDEPLLEKKQEDKKDPSDNTYLVLANSYNDSSNKILALYYYQLYLKKNSTDLDTSYKLYKIYKDINYYDGALKYLNILKGTKYIDDLNKEENDINEINKKDKPDYIYLIEKNDNNYYKGLKYFHLKNYNKALFNFTLCLSNNIFINRYIYNYMARCYSKLGNNDLYIEYLDKANRLYTKKIKNIKSPKYNDEYNNLVNEFKNYYSHKNYSACIFLYNKIKKFSNVLDIKIAFMINKCYEEMNMDCLALNNLYEIKNVLIKENYPLKTVIKNIKRLENKNRTFKNNQILKKVNTSF